MENFKNRNNQKKIMLPTENITTIYEDSELKNSDKNIRIIHFNDAYNIEPGNIEPVGGAARFSTALKFLKNQKPSLIFFSGDAVSPSSCKAYKNLILI